MSLKIEIKDNYPDDVKRLITDYNKGVDLQDIMEVNLAIDGLITLVFHSDKNVRGFANAALKEIATIQPGFLKKGIPVLLHRYKGSDEVKSEYASEVLGLLCETPVVKLITDLNILNKIKSEHSTRLDIKQQEQQRTQQFLEKAMSKEIKFHGITGEFLRLGQFYNKLIIDENYEAAKDIVFDIVNKSIKAYNQGEEEKEDFEMGGSAFLILANPDNREPLVKEVVAELLTRYQDVKKKEKEALEEFLLYVIRSIHDLIPTKLRNFFISEANKRKEAKKEEQSAKIKKIQELQKKSISVDVTWEKQVKEIANAYNEAIKIEEEKDKNKALDKFVDNLKDYLFGKDEYLKRAAIKLYWTVFFKNFELVKELTEKMISDYKKPEVAVILEENIPALEKLELPKGIKSFLLTDKQKRDEELAKEKEELRKKFERIEKLKIEFSADWDKRLLELIEEINALLIEEKIKDAEKLILGKMKPYIYAEDKEIASQTIIFLNNVAEKYPDIIQKIMKEILELYKSEHEDRWIAIDFLALLNKNPNKEKFLKDLKIEDFEKKLKEDVEKRQEDIKQSQLMDKWQAIKLDVATIVIDLEYDKKLQKVARAYNEAVKAKDLETAVKNVQIIIDWFLEEKNEEKLNQIIEVIGKISKQNIELIAPAIDMFLKMVDSEDEDKKFRAIKGLGEVTFHRPGWAYMALDRLAKMVSSDKDDKARMKALLELSRVGKSNATMLIEHKEPVINALKDENKHVRRLAAFTIGNMAEAIPLEAQEAIPALREALHDEYFLVRQFADKALKLISAAMRKT